MGWHSQHMGGISGESSMPSCFQGPLVCSSTQHRRSDSAAERSACGPAWRVRAPHCPGPSPPRPPAWALRVARSKDCSPLHAHICLPCSKCKCKQQLSSHACGFHVYTFSDAEMKLLLNTLYVHIYKHIYVLTVSPRGSPPRSTCRKPGCP